ncbi:MAG: zinc-finger domain-containing protein [Alphaproteobacteria bacterium]
MNTAAAASDARTIETVEVDTLTPTCDGGSAGGGHPRVTLRIRPEVGFGVCPYCNRRFTARAGIAGGSGH